ncbi:MAG: tetratricopeptide repeat protein [Anaerolineae bacterium]
MTTESILETNVDISEQIPQESFLGQLFPLPHAGRDADRPPQSVAVVEEEADHSDALMPPPAPELFGRDEDVEVLLEHLDQGLVISSCTGGAGMGTTALARRVAAEAAEDYPDGVIEIDLRGGEPAYLAPMSHIDAQRYLLLSLDPQTELPADPRELRRRYHATLSERRLLLILDNVTSATQIRYLLPREGSTVIVTSEHDLSKSLSKLFSWTVRELPSEDAYRLIVSITPQAADPSRRALDSLIAQLHSVPLALRLVAPLVGPSPRISPRTLMRNLNQVQKQIVALRGTFTPNTGVGAAIEVAYKFLPPGLKPYYAALAVFSAPFTVAAAAAVWQTSTATARELLDLLVRRSLVDHQPGASTYQTHHLVMLHAQELLLGQPERTRTLVFNHARHYLTEALHINERLRAPSDPTEQPSTSAAFRMLWQHLPTAWARATGEDPGWPAPAEADRWISGFPPRVMTLLKKVLPRNELFAWLAGALEAAERLDDRRTISVLLGALGDVSHAQGETQQALGYYEQQLEIARERDDHHVEGEALMHIGVIYGATGDIRRAGTSWRKALVLLEGADDHRAEHVRNWLAELQNHAAA